MEGCLTDIRKALVDKLLDKAIEKSRYLFCFTCIVKEFDDEKVKLEAERATMTQHIDMATRRDKDVQYNAQHWQTQVDELIQEDTKKKQSCFFGFCPDCIWRYKRGEELATKTKVVKSLMEKGEKIENVEVTRCLPGVERHSSQYYISFKSRKLKYKELLDALKDDRNYMVGLQGMGGAGKTTLAKEVGKQLKALEHFKYVIDTTVSDNPDTKKIQDNIAGSLGLEWGEINESDRPKRLWSRLTNGDKILVILDDVWENLNFDDIGLPNSDNHKGCKVLVTTRNLGVCNKMACGKTIQLELLDEEEAWIMFKMHADLSNISSKSILSLGRKIATKCKRLPVAIATIASSLRGQKCREEWDVALNCLQKPVSMGNVDPDLVDIFKCLKFSYDYLKDEKAKELFLLCSAFPEDEEISVELLTMLGIGVNLFGEGYDKYNDARSQAIVAKNKLLHSCLLLETEKGDVKMHDLVREVGQWIAKEEILVVNLLEKNQKSLVERSKNVKYLLFQGKLMDLSSSRFDGSKLEILIVKTSMCESEDVPTSFFENMVGLRVLNLSNSFTLGDKSLSLPKSIQLLMNIRSLSVANVDLDDISVLGTLQSLETLELESCVIDEFSPEIAKLKKLRLLSLKYCDIRSNNPFEVIHQCPSLEELYFWNSFNDLCEELTLRTLQRYHLSDCSRVLNYSISKYVSLEHNYFSEAAYKYLMQTSEYLLLDGIEGWRNLMPEMVHIDQGMNDLIELRLTDISQLQCLVDNKLNYSQVPIVFSKLVVLEMERMENLEQLFNGPISFDSMNNLEELYITECEKLQSLFQCSLNLCNLKTVKLQDCSRLVSVFELSTSQSLPMLEELKIIHCEKLENIITFERRAMDDTIEESADGYNDNKSCYSLFPKLKVLQIEECNQLQFILPILSARDFLFLEVIKIKHCHKLEYIFDQHQDVKLTSLRTMEIYYLPNFIDIFPPNASSISKHGSKPQTQLGPIKGNTFSLCCYKYKLKSTKIPFVSEDQPQQCSISLESNSYCNIKEIKIFNVSKIKSVFIPSIALRMLETLTIHNCDELTQIIDNGDHNSTSGNNFGNVFPKLKWLEVRNCVQLEYIFALKECSQLVSGDFIKESSGNEENRQQMNLTLESIWLFDLPMMTCLFVGLKYSFVLKNLKKMIIVRCEKMEIVFSTSVLRCLPQLVNLHVQECKELKHIIEDDLEDKNSQSSNTFFPKLETLIVEKCDKLKNVFPVSTSVLRCLPQLVSLQVKECKELKHIIEDDLEDKNSQSSNIFFPKLETLTVENCDKLKNVFPVSICKEFPELKVMLIIEAKELEEIFKTDKKEISKTEVEIPTVGLKYSFVLKNLTEMMIFGCEKLEIVFSTSVIRCLPQLVSLQVEECKELKHIIEDDLEDKNSQSSNTFFPKLETLLVEKCDKLKNVFPVSICKEFPELKAMIIKEANELEEIFKSDKKDEVEEISKTEVQIPNLKAIGFAYLPSLCHTQGVHFQTVKYRFVLGCQKLSLTSATSNTFLDDIRGYRLDYDVYHRLEECYEAVSEHKLTSPQEDGDSPITMTSSSISTAETNDQGSLNDDSFKKLESSNIDEQFPKDDDIIVSKSKPSPSITSPVVYQFPPLPCKEDSSQKVEDLSSLLVKSELEQLVSKNHLDCGNLSLLNDFFVKHPSVRLKDTSLSNRYKGCAYNLLAELLKFLKTHSVLEVLGSVHSEFEELLQDARRFGFDKEWLDGVERRTLCPDMQVSQDELKKLLDSKEHVTKEVEVLRLKIGILSEQMEVLSENVEVLKHQLISSQAVLESINQQEVALSAPVGY